MARLPVIDPDTATGESKQRFARVKSALGVIHNMTKVMANSAALPDGYPALAGALTNGKLDAGTRELIAITVAEVNGCEYCLSAHTYIGANVAKLDAAELDRARDAANSDARTQAILIFASSLAQTRGHLDADAM